MSNMSGCKYKNLSNDLAVCAVHTVAARAEYSTFESENSTYLYVSVCVISF